MSAVQQATAMFKAAGGFPSTGLSFYYKLDEASGSSVADSKGSNTGTLTGGAVNQSGKIGTSYKIYVADSDHILLANWRPVNNFSINFWIKNISDPGNRIIGEFNFQASNGGWIIDG